MVDKIFLGLFNYTKLRSSGGARKLDYLFTDIYEKWASFHHIVKLTRKANHGNALDSDLDDQFLLENYTKKWNDLNLSIGGAQGQAKYEATKDVILFKNNCSHVYGSEITMQ